MNQLPAGRVPREKITRQYCAAVYSYLFPALPLGLHVIDAYTFRVTGTFFLALAFGSLLPAGCIGLYFTIKGLRLAFKNKDYEKKDSGYANLIMGIVIVLAGLLAAGILYATVAA